MANLGDNYSADRVPCKICGRSFAPEVLPKHSNICKKNSITAAKRKPFDSSKQRVIEGELSLKQIKQAQKKEIKPPKSHWREKHQDFINSVRNARGLQHAIDSGGPLPPPPPPSINPDYVQCPYCSRRFSQQAADRHISFCKDQQSRLPRGKPDAGAVSKQNTRLSYQAPKLKPKAPAMASPTIPAARPVAQPAATSTRIATTTRTVTTSSRTTAAVGARTMAPVGARTATATVGAKTTTAAGSAKTVPPAGGSSRGKSIPSPGGVGRGRTAIPTPENVNPAFTESETFMIALKRSWKRRDFECRRAPELSVLPWLSHLPSGAWSSRDRLPKIKFWQQCPHDYETQTTSSDEQICQKDLDNSGYSHRALKLRPKCVPIERTPSLKSLLKYCIDPHCYREATASSREGDIKKIDHSVLKGRQSVASSLTFTDDETQCLCQQRLSPYHHKTLVESPYHHKALVESPYHHKTLVEFKSFELEDYLPSNHSASSRQSFSGNLFNSREDIAASYETSFDHFIKTSILQKTSRKQSKKSVKTTQAKPKATSKLQQDEVGAIQVDSGMFEGQAQQRLPSKITYCHECGSRYPISTAKFCCECGIEKIGLSKNKTRRSSRRHSHGH